MKILIKKIIILLFLTLFLLNIFRYNDVVTLSSLKALELWRVKLFPSLFIMFIINDLIINTEIFKFKNNNTLAFSLSLFSGTPTNAYIIKELYINNKISLNSANRLLLYIYFSNPLFLYNILSSMFNKTIVIKLIIIHYISNFIISLFVKKEITYNNKIDQINLKITKVLEQSIKKSINTLLMILGTVTFFMIISNLIVKLFSLNTYLEILIKGVLEITQSLNELAAISLNSKLKQLLALIIISFGGISIHMQVYSILSETKINYKSFLKGRIFQTLISILLLLVTFIIEYTIKA